MAGDVAPVAASTTSDTTPLLDWNDVSGASGYELQLADAGDKVAESPAVALATSQFQTTAGLALGTWYWRVRAKNADNVWSAWSSTWSFTVAWTYALTPTPVDAGTTSDTTPLMDWNDVSGASGYELQLADAGDKVAESPVVSLATSQFQTTTGLTLGTWHWRVRAENADDVWGAWSSTWSFTVAWTYALTPMPADAGTTSDTTPLLDWNDVTGAGGYELQLADTSAGVDASTAVASAVSQYPMSTTLALGDLRYWRVRAKNADNVWGAWSSTWSFTASWTYILTPTPVDAGTTSDTTPMLDWNDVESASGYEVQIADTSAGVASSTAIASVMSQHPMSATLALGDVRYWRVRAKNADDVWGAWSGTWSFTIAWTVGETGPAGGLVFHDKGSYSAGWRYLEAAPVDQPDAEWFQSMYTYVGNTSSAIGAGGQNTVTLVTNISGACAARVCSDLSLGGFADWFLPSKDELNQMYLQLHSKGLGGFANDWYWSSTGAISYDYCGYRQNFTDGMQYEVNDFPLRIRAARSF